MAEYTQEALDKVIKDHLEKQHSQIQALRLKHVHRERIESEIVELKVELEKTEDFITLMQGIKNGIEDKEITDGLKAQRRLNRVRRSTDKS